MQTDTPAPTSPPHQALVFFTGNDRLDYKAGHFLTIDPHQFEALDRFTSFLEHLKGKPEPPRAYSMCASPHERYLAVSVKEERYLSILKYALDNLPTVRHTFVYSNKTWNDVIFRGCGPGISKFDREAAREAGTELQPKFIETTLAHLREIGVPDARIKRESYG
jgi:hypothetical protein